MSLLPVRQQRQSKPYGLSERALWYGLHMLQKAGGMLRPAVETSNAYERRLLVEVVPPETSGRGFSEVGPPELVEPLSRGQHPMS